MRHKDLTVGADYYVNRGNSLSTYRGRIMRLIDDTLVFPMRFASTWNTTLSEDRFDNGGRPRYVTMQRVRDNGELEDGGPERIPLFAIRMTADEYDRRRQEQIERADRLVAEREAEERQVKALNARLSAARLPLTIRTRPGVGWEVTLDKAGAIDAVAEAVNALLARVEGEER